MPKRAQTPPPADDTRFFTVVNPYPEHPYVALEDSKTFARWIACMIGQEHLLAFHHKPKSPNVVIIETSRFGPDFGRLMGEHRWCMVLKDPGEFEREEASYIFPCALTTTRAIEKTGWICRDIPSSWFRKWSPASDSLIVSPYPPPRHCEPPSEDVTRYPLCRPIPHKPEATPGSASYRNSLHAASSDDDLSTLPSSPASEVSDAPTAPVPFIPAIHGCDAPKASAITTAFSTAATVHRDTPPDSSDDDAEDARTTEAASHGLCSAHGTLCVSGICKECAARKREVRHAERALQREAEHAWRRRGRGPGHQREGSVPSSRPVPDMPPHLQQHRTPASASTSSSPDAKEKEGNPRSRLRDDIRVEMKARKQGARSVVSASTRAMPAHLLKGSSKPVKTRISSAPTTSLPAAPNSAGMHAYDSLSESGSEPAQSPLSDSSECAQSMSSRTSAASESQASSISARGDAGVFGKSGASRAPPGNPWKKPQPARPTPFKWADHVEKSISSAGVRSSWDDDSSEEEEVF